MERQILRDEQGVALVISLILLLVLTLIGFSSINTTTFEANITGNERIGIEAFNAAEAGSQEGLGKLPDVSPFKDANLGQGSSYWSGGPADEGAPAPILSFGLHRKAGFDTGWGFKRFRVHVTGKSSGATKEVEAQMSLGPYPMDTTH